MFLNIMKIKINFLKFLRGKKKKQRDREQIKREKKGKKLEMSIRERETD